MEKQTAVQWLIKQLPLIQQEGLRDIFEEAKYMEKQQIINSYNQSWHFRDKPYETAEKYYNETFGKL
jgi:hypothetical protein